MGKQMTRCVIVGSAPFSDAAYLKTYLRADDYIIGADGGQRLLAAMGCTPCLLIGDFDSSLPPDDMSACTVLPTHKDDTDVLAAMRIALEKGCREFLLLGCLGGRFDHTLANVFLLRFLYSRGAKGLIVDECHEISLLAAGDHIVAPREGCFFSLLPYGGDVCGVTVKNAEYPLDNATLDTVFPLGVSNGFIGKPVEISLKDGFLLLILAKEA